VSTVAGLFNPVGVELVFVSAMAASFGGTLFLGWLFVWVRGREWGDTVSHPLTPSRSTSWLAIGVLGVVVYVFVFGPGLPR